MPVDLHRHLDKSNGLRYNSIKQRRFGHGIGAPFFVEG